MDPLKLLDFSSFIIFSDDPWSLLVSFCQLFKLPLVVQCCDVICEWPLSWGYACPLATGQAGPRSRCQQVTAAISPSPVFDGDLGFVASQLESGHSPVHTHRHPDHAPPAAALRPPGRRLGPGRAGALHARQVRAGVIQRVRGLHDGDRRGIPHQKGLQLSSNNLWFVSRVCRWPAPSPPWPPTRCCPTDRSRSTLTPPSSHPPSPSASTNPSG